MLSESSVYCLRQIQSVKAAIIGIIGLLACDLAFADTNNRAAQVLRDQISQITKDGPPGILLMVKSRDLSLQLSTGIADIATQEKATTGDAWRIASVTKLVTASIIMQLIQEHQIRLDDRLSAYLPNSVRLASDISIRQLLNNTSGIPDYLAAPHVPLNVSARHLSANLVRQRPTPRLLTDARSQRRRFAPGSQYDYSNTNYLLLGLIIEKVTGRSFQGAVRDRIIAPLKLMRTEFPDSKGSIHTRHLRGYVPGDLGTKAFSDKNSLIDVTTHDYFLGGDGGLYSTLDETTRILRYVLGGNSIEDSLRREMVTNMNQDHDGFYRYGLGVMEFTLPCQLRVYGHEGRDLGIYTVALLDPKHDRSFVLAANMSFGHEWGIQRRIDQLRNDVFCASFTDCSKSHKH